MGKGKKSVNVRLGNVSAAPDSVIVKLKYGHHRVWSYGSTDEQHDVFRVNGAHPNEDASENNRPVGWPDWAAFYNRYRVRHIHVDVTGIAQGIGNLMAVYPVTTVPTTFDRPNQILANPRSKWKLMNANAKAERIQCSWEPNELFGIAKQAYLTDTVYTASTGGTPTQQYFFVVSNTVAPESTNAGYGAYVYVTISYDVEFYDRKELDMSALLRENDLARDVLARFQKVTGKQMPAPLPEKQ